MGQSLVSKTRRLALEYNLYLQIQPEGHLIIFCQKWNKKYIKNVIKTVIIPDLYTTHSIVASVLLSAIIHHFYVIKNYIFILFLISKCV